MCSDLVLHPHKFQNKQFGGKKSAGRAALLKVPRAVKHAVKRRWGWNKHGDGQDQPHTGSFRWSRENLPRWNVAALPVARPVRHSPEQLQGHGASAAPRYVPGVPDGRAVPGIRAWKRTRPRPALPRDHPSPPSLSPGTRPGLPLPIPLPSPLKRTARP